MEHSIRRLLVTGRLRVHRRQLHSPRAGDRPADLDHQPRRADLRRQPGQPGGPGGASRATGSCAATSPTGPPVVKLVAGGEFDAIVNFAAESHVDRSIHDAAPFLRTNVLGTQCLLDAAREAKVPRYVQVSTDEVYGTLGPTTRPFTETTPLAPNSPYAASKAAADLLVRAVRTTRYGLDDRHHPLLEQLRPVPVPREADPAVHHQRPGRQAGARLRRRHAGPRLDPRPRPLPGRRRRAAPRAGRARSTTSAAGASGTTWT